MIVSFLVFLPSCAVSISFNFLLSFHFFGTLSFMPKIFFRYLGLPHCWLMLKTVKSCLEALSMCFGICYWLWVSLQCHLTGPLFFFSWERPELGMYFYVFFVFTFFREGPLVLCPLIPGACKSGSQDQLSRRQVSHHSTYKLPPPPLSLWNPPVTWTGSGSPYPLLYHI